MSSAKAALKTIGSSIQAAKYEDAVQQSEKLLVNEPQNFQANIFRGFALDKLTRFEEAERAYLQAAKLKPDDPQAWQGLIKVYEKQGNKKIDEYQTAALRLAEIYRDLDDKYKCQDVVDKFTVFAKSQGTRQQHRKALEILLPTSPIYQYLEGRIPHPSHTYQTIVQIIEAEEKEKANKEIGERRTRLGARINQVTLDVRREIFRDSPLEDLYSRIIDWCNDDEIRRQYEEKLLQRCYDALIVLPSSQKDGKRSQVSKLASDMVIIKHPFKLAWDIALEWQDHALIEHWDVGVLREYCSFFPATGLAKVLQGFLASEISPFPAEAASETDDEDGGVTIENHEEVHTTLSPEDRLVLMTDGMSDASDSILAHRLMGEYYAFLDEHESVVELMRSGINLVDEMANKTALKLRNQREALTVILGTALVFYQSPRNHPEAKVLFDSILSENPTSTPSLIGVGLIYEEEEDLTAALDFLERALQRDPKNIRVKVEAAWVKAQKGDYEEGRDQLEACLPEIDGTDLRSRDLRAQTQYRIGVCMWNIDTSASARRDRKGAYSYFLAALKSNLNYAPAYTSLGIFYNDYSKDKKRARKCFQKAFELSASEVHAAERLARSFAEKGEWDLVEVVAQRVVDSGKVRPAPGSRKRGISWPFTALGVAELHKQDYAKSIASFQAALRISPNDYHSWVGLGESYHNSGRYIAATKAFTHAEKFEREVEQQKTGDVWFAKYMLANVKRELGEYDTSIDSYKTVLKLRPDEFGVSIALIQTVVENAWNCVDNGLFGKAARLATEAISYAGNLCKTHENVFNLWKAFGDACSIFSVVQEHLSSFPDTIVKQALQGQTKAFEILRDVDGDSLDILSAQGLFPDDEQYGLDITRCIQGTLLCYKCAIFAVSNDSHAQAVAYYNLGWAEYMAHTCISPGFVKKKTTRYLKAAMHCFKRAIEFEAGNAEFWNALGVVTSEVAPKVAQHSFVRSLYLNERSAQAWTNYGTLCLLQNDLQLANEAFTRAQSTDPDFAHAWLGQGLTALLLGEPKEARLLFTHAIEISESSSMITKRQYSLSTFDHIIASTANSSIIDLVQPSFVLNQLRSLTPNDLPYQHLLSLFLERIEDTLASQTLLFSICEKLEANYEITESPSSLSRFAMAKADLARSLLTAGLFEEALDTGETALSLSAEDAGNQLTNEERQRCRFSAYLTMTLADYHLHETQKATGHINAALEESDDNPDAICLLAQILWATGDPESKAQARDRLFDAVESHPGHIQSILLLGTIALLDNDLESLEAVTSDLQTLRSNQDISSEEQAMVEDVLLAIAALTEDDTEQSALSELQSYILLHPDHPYGWMRLAEFDEEEYAAEMAVKTAVRGVPPRGALETATLAQAFAGTGKLGDAQKAIMLTPWKQGNWDALEDCIS